MEFNESKFWKIMMKKKQRKKKNKRKTYKKRNETFSQSVGNFLKLVFLIAAVAFIIYHFFFRSMDAEPEISSAEQQTVKTNTESKPRK